MIPLCSVQFQYLFESIHALFLQKPRLHREIRYYRRLASVWETVCGMIAGFTGRSFFRRAGAHQESVIGGYTFSPRREKHTC